MPIPIIVLLLVLVLIAVRRIGQVHLQIWQIMGGAALVVLLTGQIAPADALAAINTDVMLFLLGMFVVGQALEASGYLAHLSYSLFRRARTGDQLLLLLLLGMGLGAALLMNDTIAIVGTPMVVALACAHQLPARMLMLALAFAVTIGSVMSPIGNPQNLLIALNGGLESPFVTFLRYLLAPTLLNLGVAFALLKLYYRREMSACQVCHVETGIADEGLARWCRVAVGLLVALILAKIATVSFRLPFDLSLVAIALIPAVPILVFSPRRWQVLRGVDWSTLVFFAAMFVLMESVWETGVIQSAIGNMGINVNATGTILGVSVALSQLISNVPLVALYLPMLLEAGAGTRELMALAAGSTVAGNLLILGAASNVIIIHNAEKRCGETLTFWEFARVGLPLTALNVAIYWLFLR
ncbi:MAG: anion transporter [Chloroflexi bacterium]|nr:anion transporter [Chloroflexota bacterium]